MSLPTPSSIQEYRVSTPAVTVTATAPELPVFSSPVLAPAMDLPVNTRNFDSAVAAIDPKQFQVMENPPSVQVSDSSIGVDMTDRRVRISMPPQSPDIFYKDTANPLMAPLAKTRGFIFPIQPNISIAYEAAYQDSKPTHSNFPYYHYTNSAISPISLTGDFPVRATVDAQYVMAGIHFLRSCTRMFNGQDGMLAGAPPLILRLTGLGFAGFDNIPVVITNCTVNYPDNVDYLSFKPFDTSELARMPVNVSIQVTLNPVFSRTFITNQYSTLAYSNAMVRLLGPNNKPSYSAQSAPAENPSNMSDRVREIGPPPDLMIVDHIPGTAYDSNDEAANMAEAGVQSIFSAANNLPQYNVSNSSPAPVGSDA